MRKPWLPDSSPGAARTAARWRASATRMAPWLRAAGAAGPAAHAGRARPPRSPAPFTGLLLVLLGLLLALPIPFTNYLFGVLLLLFALRCSNATAR